MIKESSQVSLYKSKTGFFHVLAAFPDENESRKAQLEAQSRIECMATLQVLYQQSKG